MKKMLALVLVVLIVSISAYMVFAKNLSSMGVTQKNAFKTMLQNYFHPVFHGYGIGLSDGTYITAKWHITNVRTLATNRIREIIGNNTNATDWSQIREQIQNAIQSEGTEIKKGRIRIGDTNYALTNIVVSNETASADINTLPDYTTCKQANKTAEVCETESAKVGDFSLTKKTNALEDTQPDPKVWAGTLNFNDITYTFVTFAYPRW